MESVVIVGGILLRVNVLTVPPSCTQVLLSYINHVFSYVATEYHNGYKTLCYASWPQESTTGAFPSQGTELPVQHYLSIIVCTYKGQKGCLETAFLGYSVLSDFLLLVCCDRQTSLLHCSKLWSKMGNWMLEKRSSNVLTQWAKTCSSQSLIWFGMLSKCLG